MRCFVLATCAVLFACADPSGRTPNGAPILIGVSTAEQPLEAGARPRPDLAEGTDLLPEVEHIVVLMMENHSFDNYFGVLGRGDGLTIGADGVASNENPDDDERPVRAFHLPTTSQAATHVSPSWAPSHLQFGEGRNDGFVKSVHAPDPMGHFDGADIPYYHAIARAFPIFDRYFASLLGPTYPNRRFLSAGTADGLVRTDLEALGGPPIPSGTIFDALERHHVTWRNYHAAFPELVLFPGQLDRYESHVATIERFLADAASGELPAYSLVTPAPGVSEEDPQDIRDGAAFSKMIIEAVLRSPAWPKTLFLLNYDEHGGYYDHVAPPPAFAPDETPPDPMYTSGYDVGYTTLGFRVPAVLLSPYARADYVSHVVSDHTSVLRLIETKWNLGALTRRDANASNLLDALDFWAEPTFLHPPAFD